MGKMEDDGNIFIPIKPEKALENLSTIADRLLDGPKKIDAVKLVEESLDNEAGIH
ncbi:MAG: hypothetical protein ACP6IP_07995 [Candidatus Njordarchaeia archaeon]